ncbi:hypothetical protein AQUSIP_15860 [Aquicella siphonis]|uniref:Uncharacterized protein n=1 Tax=Aquicella siphonis TaxID=254247 RepID=A0A5E4PIL7_9COXI|nr:Mth938-like domain-containing protein [Aquicella siphonis]VVC76277.1 hypothetical protein AQUSIP_15860 [Aquicella siphonis]
MATLDLDDNQAQYQIRSFKPGAIQVNEKTITSSIIITPDELVPDWQPQTVSELTAASLNVIAELKPDILLIGTGPTHMLLSIEIYGSLINQGIGVEVMATPAACRTFNALCAENRRVAAALIIS